MDLQTVKYGLSIAACGLVGVVAFFALYLRMGQAAQNRTEKRD